VAHKTIGEVLAAEGIRPGTAAWHKRVLEIVAGPVEAERLAGLTPRQLNRELASAAASAMGRRRSPAKRDAARQNGKAGGRPRQSLPCIRCGQKTTERDQSRRPHCGCAK
jgi:hypothetical protein